MIHPRKRRKGKGTGENPAAQALRRRRVEPEHDPECNCIACQEYGDHYGSGYNGDSQ